MAGLMQGLFMPRKDPKVPKPPTTSSADVQKAAADAQKRAALARGRSSTVLTGGGLGNVG